MKKKTLQFFAAFLSLVMLSTSSSLSTLALGKDSITESQISNQYQADYIRWALQTVISFN